MSCSLLCSPAESWKQQWGGFSKALACNCPATRNYTPGTITHLTTACSRTQICVQPLFRQTVDIGKLLTFRGWKRWLVGCLELCRLSSPWVRAQPCVCSQGFAVVSQQGLNQKIVALWLFSSTSVHCFTGLLTAHSP